MNNNNGTMYNGTCFDFDGTDDKVVTNNAVITGTGDFTITAWINRATVNTYDYVCGNYGSGNTGGIEVYGKTNGTVILYIGAALTTSTVMTADTWYHFAATRTSGVCKLYMNGVLDVSGTLASSIGGSNNFSIGNAADYTSENFDGKIADVKAFNVALSAANIKELYDDSKVIIPTKNAAAGGFVSQTNLIGWWPLAEGAGNVCYDGSGNGYHGTASNTDGDEWLTGQTGCPQLVEGYNRAMLFDGSNDGAIKDVAGYRSGDSSGTMAAWVNFSAIDAWQVVVGSFDFASADYYIEIILRNDGKIAFSQRSNDTGDYFYYNSALTVNTWYHVAVTSDGSSYTLYLNGAEVTKTFVTGSDTGDWFADTANRDNVCVGILKYNSTYANWLDGLATEVVVYDTPLSAGQISTLATTDANGAPLPPLTLPAASNVVGHWRYDNDVTWTDLSSGGNNLTVTGSPSSLLFKQGYNGSASTSTGRDGQGFPLKFKNNGAIGFNGSDDYVNIADSSLWDATGGISVSCWCYANSLGSYNVIINQWDTSANSSSSWTVETVGSDWRFYIYDSGSAALRYASSTGTATTGVWKHIVGVFDGTTVKVYVDGVEGGTTGTVTTANTASFPLRLGRFYDTATGSWDGQIGNARIYNRFLSRAEIKQNYNAQKSRFT